jgi:hypothetical protein
MSVSGSLKQNLAFVGNLIKENGMLLQECAISIHFDDLRAAKLRFRLIIMWIP